MPQEFILSFIVCPKLHESHLLHVSHLFSLHAPFFLHIANTFAPVTLTFLRCFGDAFSFHWFMLRIYLPVHIVSRKRYQLRCPVVPGQSLLMRLCCPSSQRTQTVRCNGLPHVLTAYLAPPPSALRKQTLFYELFFLQSLSLRLNMSTDKCMCEDFFLPICHPR